MRRATSHLYALKNTKLRVKTLGHRLTSNRTRPIAGQI